ncbi:MAG: VOC family protein [Planctomycetota bacterium]|nr:VOC family protein [Planctomycetota bacterium]
MPTLASIQPLLIVADLARAVGFYRDVLGFEVRVQLPEHEPFFAIVGRDGVGLLLKHVSAEVEPLPNPQRQAWAKWDAFVSVAQPEQLAAELRERAARLPAGARGPAQSFEVHDTEDGLRGLEVTDADGYVLFLGHPR